MAVRRLAALLLSATLLLAAGQGVFAGSWSTLPSMPAALGEVAAGLLTDKNGNDKLVVVGEGNALTYIYNVAARKWSTGAKRPFVGHHIAAEVIDGKLYLFGGLGSGGTKVQIYNLDADKWTTGSNIPYGIGSAATARIGGYVYLCGGILLSGLTTTNKCVKYNIQQDKWEQGVTSMPRGVNHAAAATDGQKMYVAGGRDGPNRVSPGFNTMQIYNPDTNKWSMGASLPEARGGTGRAVVQGGSLYVFGGETTKTSGPGLTGAGTYNRVDVYNIQNDKWSKDTAMPVARHGIYPVADGKGGIFVTGGGVKRASSKSAVNALFKP